MNPKNLRNLKKLPVLLAAAAAALSLAATGALPKLPAPRPMARTGDSPSVVLFDHEQHVDAKKPDCTVCHPKTFRILHGESKPLTHEQMKKGEACGMCHNGKVSFDLDNCEMCHKG